MIVAGLTGGAASGKNTVSKMLEKLGAKVIDADIISRELVEPGKPAWRAVINAFGRDILTEKGEIDRKKLGEIVFNEEGKRRLLNSILHPRIIEEELRRAARIERDEPEALVVVNAALLIESGNYRAVDVVVVVTAREEIMIRRMMERDDLTRREAVSRLNCQMPTNEKAGYADYLIENNSSLTELEVEAVKLYRMLIGRRKAG